MVASGPVQPPTVNMEDTGGVSSRRPGGVLDDLLVAREVSLVHALGVGALAAVALLWLPVIAVVIYAFFSRWMSGARWEQVYTRPGLDDLGGVVVQYVLTVGLWTLVAAPFGALLGALRRLSARRGHWWLVTLVAGQVLQFGWHSLVAGLAVPLLLLLVIFRWSPAWLDVSTLPLLWVGLFPLWLVSGLAVEVLWEAINGPILRRIVPLPVALRTSLAVQAALGAEPNLRTARIEDVSADPDTGTVYVRGKFVDAEQVRRVQQVCMRVASVKRVVVTPSAAVPTPGTAGNTR